MYFNGIQLASGTGFFAEIDDSRLFFTNRHNVTGLNNETGEPLSSRCAVPNKIKIHFPVLKHLNQGDTDLDVYKGINSWRVNTYNLYADDAMSEPHWIEHPDGSQIDVVGIDIDVESDQFAYNVASSEWYQWQVGDLVNVVGYPFGLSADKFPIWMTGHIASEPDIDYDNLPKFLIDCRTRQGQSGSPVLAKFRPGQYYKRNGETYQVIEEHSFFLGIYSGRVRDDSDIGVVWKPSILEEILIKHRER